MLRKTTKTALACLVAMLCGASGASASSGQLAIFQDDRLLLETGGTTQLSTLDELRGLGVDVVKFDLEWANVAPRGTTRPAGFDAANPASYPSAAWAAYDALIHNARARGFDVLLQINGPAPGWATARRGDTSGVDRPSGREFSRFVQAVGSRFPGVRFWAIWNEPNHPRFLYPQASRGVPRAPSVYRSLVSGAVTGLRRSGHGRDRILFGELLPIGKTRLSARNTMKPLRFMREMFCLDRRYRRYRGRAARRRGCSRYRRITGVRGFSYHPYTRVSGPRGREPSRDDATIRSFGRITRVLDLAQRRRRLGGPRRMRVYNTEFGYQSNPPDPFQATLRRIPGFLAEAEWISFRNRRVASWSQYTLQDLPLQSGGDRYGLWQGGLKFSSGRPKRGMIDAYRVPIFVRLLGRRHVEVWGAARPGGRGAAVQVQQGTRGTWRNLGRRIVTRNSRGYFRVRFRISQAARRVYRFRYYAGGATFTSRRTKAAIR